MKFELSSLKRIFLEQGFLGVMRKCWLYALFPFKILANKNVKQEQGLEGLVNFTFTVCSGLIKPLQVKSEILGLITLLEKASPQIVVEIGTNVGGNLLLFSQVAHERADIISIDLPRGLYGGGYPAWRIPIYRLFPHKEQKLHLIRGDSHDVITLKKLKALLGKERIDFLFIDGDHSYEGVRQDFEMYRPLVKPGGLIGFHDIAPRRYDDGCGVDKFWAEIKEKYECREIVQSWNQNWAGIGVITL